MSDQTTKLQVRGKALYLEFRHPSLQHHNFQLLFHPDGANSAGGYIRFGVFYRTLNSSYPKRPWSTARTAITGATNREFNELENRLVPLGDPSLIMSATESVLELVNGLLDQATRQGYSLYKQPIIVEMSNVDFDDLSHERTPYALVRRVMSARKALGFPEDLTAPVTTTTTPTTV